MDIYCYFQAQDYEAACSWCIQLVKGGHGEGWEICARLGKCKDLRDFTYRAKLLDFSLTYASFEHLEDLLLARDEVELSLLYGQVSYQIEPNVSLDSDDGFEDARADDFEEESCEEWEDPRPESPPSSFASKRLLFSVTKNVLSATATSTSSIVSSVANKRMWKNALGWLRPLRGVGKPSRSDTLDKLSNLDFSKQGCHAFYCDLNPEAHVSILGPSYKSYAPVSITNPKLEVSFTLLRIALMEESLWQGNNMQTNVAVLQEVIKGVLQEDLLLGISFLLLLNSPQDVNQVFSSLPRTEISLQIFLYYYALQIYTILYPWHKSGIAPVFLHAPDDVINCVRNIIKGNSAPAEDVKEYIDYFVITDRMINDYVQGQALHRLDAGIDIERFLAEPEYKKDTVLGLAMTCDPEVMDLSITLAKKYNVSLWEVYMTHLQFLFDSTDIDNKELQRLINVRKIVSNLKLQPTEFVSSMEKNILYSISGKDHEKLALYFSLIAEGSDDDVWKETAKLHISFLNQLKDVAPNLDYKTLLTPNSDSLEILKPVLSAKNVDILAKVAQNISKKAFILEPSMIYCAWAQKHFFDLSGKRKPKTANEWIKRFAETKESLKKLKPKDVNLLIKSLVFSEEAISQVPLDARKEMIKRSATYCKTKSEEGQDESETESWLDAYTRFEKLEKHMELLRSEIFKNLSESSDSKLRDYAHQFMLSGGDESCLENLSRQVLGDLCSLDVLRSLLAVYPEDATQIPEDIFLDVLKITLNNLRQSYRGDVELEKEYRVYVHLVKELNKYCDEGGDLLDPEDVLEEIRSFAQNESNNFMMRLKVLSTADEILSFSESDKHLLQSMKTGNIVSEAFSSPSKGTKDKVNFQPAKTSSNIDTVEGREELLQKLIDNMDSVKKAKSIIELLNIWPRFEAVMYSKVDSNPLLLIFLKLLGQSKLKHEKDFFDVMFSSSKQYFREEKMTDECILILVRKLLELSSGESLKCAFKIALIASHTLAQQDAIEEYVKHPKIKESYYDEELLKLIIEKKMAANILHTILYGPLFSYLSEERNGEELRSVVGDLEASQHWIEAASLAMFSSPIPRALKTASTAVKTFKKWL